MEQKHRKTLAVALVVGAVGLLFVLFNKGGITGAASLVTEPASTSTLWIFVLLGMAIYAVLALFRKGQRE